MNLRDWLQAAVFGGLIVCASAGTGAAYPQFQLRDGRTCTSCHLAPGGGGLLNQNGILSAEQLASRSGDGAFARTGGYRCRTG